MPKIRRSDERGHADRGWLKSYHTFSFDEYHDPAHMGFRVLRVLNEDWLAPGRGIDTHPHRDMEIVTYVLEGALAHRDSLGNTEILKAGELQRMSAGTGILHSEFNASPTESVHIYQIWILPERRGVTPSYEQKMFDRAERKNRFQLVASPDGSASSLRIGQDARLWLADLDAGQTLALPVAAGRSAWLQVLRGSVVLGQGALATGDGVAIGGFEAAELRAEAASEVMLFDLP